jgi:DNA-binding protein HU-beta
MAQITKSLKDGNDVSLIGFGSFTVKDRPARTGRNPRTGDEIKIAACKAAGFKAGKPLKDAINA